MRNGWCSPPAVYHIAPSGPLTIPPRSLPGSGVAYSTMVARDSVAEIEDGGCMLGGPHAVIAMLNASALDRITREKTSESCYLWARLESDQLLTSARDSQGIQQTAPFQAPSA